MYKHVYVCTCNSHASALSSHPISGKQGFVHNDKAGKITDYFFFEKLPLFSRIMKFEHLWGELKLLQFIGCWERLLFSVRSALVAWFIYHNESLYILLRDAALCMMYICDTQCVNLFYFYFV